MSIAVTPTAVGSTCQISKSLLASWLESVRQVEE